MNFWTEIRTGWELTLRKWSVQINIANAIWSAGALLAYQFDFLPLWFVPWGFGLALVLIVLSSVVSNLPQKEIVTVKRGPVDGFHEEGR